MEGEKDSSIKVGTVLFSANNNSNNKDFWDDSELIAHWDQTVQQYRRSIDNKQKEKAKKKSILKKPVPKPIRPVEKARPTKQARPIKQTQVPAQPMNDDSLSNLIMSWYYAGYYTALYQAQQQQQQQHYQYQQEQEQEED